MSEVNYQEIGKRIRAIRQERGMTQEETSERCDITLSFYGNIERGDKKMSVETLMKIAKGLSVSTDFLLFGAPPDQTVEALRVCSRAQEQGDELQYRKFVDIMKAVSTIVDKL